MLCRANAATQDFLGRRSPLRQTSHNLVLDFQSNILCGMRNIEVGRRTEFRY